MSAEILKFNGQTKLDISVEDVLSGALAADLDSVIIIGRTKGEDGYVASSIGDIAETFLQIELAKAFIIRMVDQTA